MTRAPDSVPTFPSHYYEAAAGPFRSLTRLVPGEDERLLNEIRREGATFASWRAPDYLAVRRELESRVRALFVAVSGQPVLQQPHYMILGASPWMSADAAQPVGRTCSSPHAARSARDVLVRVGQTWNPPSSLIPSAARYDSCLPSASTAENVRRRRSMSIVGHRMKLFGVLAVLLVPGGVGLALYGPEVFGLGGWIAGMICIVIACAGRALVLREERHAGA